MPVACVGLSHRTAALPLREQLAFGRAEVVSLLSRARSSGLESAGIAELSLLSTCNRTELYAAARHPSNHLSDVSVLLGAVLAESRGLPPHQVGPVLYGRTGAGAVRHLCRVASGLDSMVLGEAEVLGQVASAQEWATQAKASGPILEAAFRTALRAGRRARAETGIGRNPMSAASEAVRLVAGLVPAHSPVLLVGTGDLARLLGKVLRRQGFSRLAVIGRTSEHTRSIATALEAQAYPWHELREALQSSAAVLACTSATHPVITRDLVASALAHRDQAPLVLVDLAVPRDIETGVRDLPGASLFDLDGLQERLDRNLDDRRREIPRVEGIIEEEVALFEVWRNGAELRPVLAAMHARGEAIRRQETERALRRLGEDNPRVRREIEALSRVLVAKLLHAPSARLRTETDPHRSQQYVGAVRDLFALDRTDPVQADPGSGPA